MVEDVDVDNGLSYSCDCAFEFTGVVCETPIPCLKETNLCLNSGVCENSEDYTSHTCSCRMFYGGPDCRSFMSPFRTSAMSFVIGDPHYFTFDGPKIDPQGVCAYQATKLCVDDADEAKVDVDGGDKYLPYFQVVADHNWSPSAHGYPTVSVIHGMEVFYRLPTVNRGENTNYSDIFDFSDSESLLGLYEDSDLYHFRIHQTLSKQRMIYLNVNNGENIKLRPGENFESQGIATRKVGEFHEIYLGVGFQAGEIAWLANTATVIEDFVLKIRYRFRGPHGQLYLQASELLQSKICGLFGNYNGVNDVELPEGQDKKLHEQYSMTAYSYEPASVNQTFDFVDQNFECNTMVIYEECAPHDELTHRATCEEINLAPFEHCDLDRENIIEACIFDLCAGMDEDETICDMFENYVSRCNGNGASQNFIIDWRGSRCPLICGENQVYNSCGKSACQATTNYCNVDVATCESSVECTDGCYCDEGFLLNEDGDCVSDTMCDHSDISRIVFEASLCYECLEVKPGQWSAFKHRDSVPVSAESVYAYQGMDCVKDDIYEQCKIFTSKASCENCQSLNIGEQIGEQTCAAMVAENWTTDDSKITTLYHSDDFAACVYIDRTLTIIDENNFIFHNSDTNITYTEFSHDPSRAIDGSISKAMANSPPGWKLDADILVVSALPMLINFGRVYPQFKPCTGSNPLGCRTENYEFSKVIVNNEVVCTPRYEFSDVLSILEGCDHWLYFDCPIDVMAENFTLTNNWETEMNNAMQVVEFQAGFLDRN